MRRARDVCFCQHTYMVTIKYCTFYCILNIIYFVKKHKHSFQRKKGGILPTFNQFWSSMEFQSLVLILQSAPHTYIPLAHKCNFIVLYFMNTNTSNGTLR